MGRLDLSDNPLEYLLAPVIVGGGYPTAGYHQIVVF
tara:strand:+ start:770 stop:877 length:108 start_codon:yes stop_codon:yes gene_type:complete